MGQLGINLEQLMRLQGGLPTASAVPQAPVLPPLPPPSLQQWDALGVQIAAPGYQFSPETQAALGGLEQRIAALNAPPAQAVSQPPPEPQLPPVPLPPELSPLWGRNDLTELVEINLSGGDVTGEPGFQPDMTREGFNALRSRALKRQGQLSDVATRNREVLAGDLPPEARQAAMVTGDSFAPPGLERARDVGVSPKQKTARQDRQDARTTQRDAALDQIRADNRGVPIEVFQGQQMLVAGETPPIGLWAAMGLDPQFHPDYIAANEQASLVAALGVSQDPAGFADAYRALTGEEPGEETPEETAAGPGISRRAAGSTLGRRIGGKIAGGLKNVPVLGAPGALLDALTRSGAPPARGLTDSQVAKLMEIAKGDDKEKAAEATRIIIEDTNAKQRANKARQIDPAGSRAFGYGRNPL